MGTGLLKLFSDYIKPNSYAERYQTLVNKYKERGYDDDDARKLAQKVLHESNNI